MDGIKQGVERVAQALWDENGYVAASALVSAARDPSSPAHAGFEWNDAAAGHEFRLVQARAWLRRVTIVVENRADRLVNIPVHKSAAESEGEYRPMSVVVKQPDQFARALEQLQQKLAAAKFAVDQLLEAAEASGCAADKVAMIAQLSKAAALWADALKRMH